MGYFEQDEVLNISIFMVVNITLLPDKLILQLQPPVIVLEMWFVLWKHMEKERQ